MYLIVGLGNPGSDYEQTRHNIGFKVIDALSKDLDISVTKNHCRAFTGQGKLLDHKILLAKPQTFMNLSGESVRELALWHKISPEKILIIYDDLDLEPGQLLIKPKGSSGGHKGIESIILHLKTTEFARIRIGIGRSPGGDNADYVLAKVPPSQREIMGDAIVTATEAARKIIEFGLDAAMNEYNKK